MSESSANEQRVDAQPAFDAHVSPQPAATDPEGAIANVMPRTLEELRAYVAERVRTGEDDAARIIPPDWKEEGSPMYEDAKKLAKLLFISRGGLNDESVEPLLRPPPFRNLRSLTLYLYLDEQIIQTMAKVVAEMMEKLFTDRFRDWVATQVVSDDFTPVIASDFNKIREYFIARAGMDIVCWVWEPAIGDTADLNYIFDQSPFTSDEDGNSRQRQQTRLILLFGHAAQLCLIWELKKTADGDLTDRDAMFDAFANVWREESMLDPKCEVQWKEWKVVE